MSQIVTGFFLTFYYTAGAAFETVQYVMFELSFSCGQISYWAAVVITSLISSVPYFEGFRVCSNTLKFFYSIHFILPWFLLVLIVFHLFFLHFTGSSSSLYCHGDYDKFVFSFNLSDSMIFVESDCMASPAHVVPDKILGVILIFSPVFVLLLLIFPKNYCTALDNILPAFVLCFYSKYSNFSIFPAMFGVGLLGVDVRLLLFMSMGLLCSIFRMLEGSILFRLSFFGFFFEPFNLIGGGGLEPFRSVVPGLLRVFINLYFIGRGFLCFQYYKYGNNCFVMRDSVYGSIFYIGTGLHGFRLFFLLLILFDLKYFILIDIILKLMIYLLIIDNECGGLCFVCYMFEDFNVLF
uniref:Cytochrome b n=1 Tax=Elaeophora elaphi TaxID=1147741 RepID=A0A0R3RN92_9BILA